MYLSKHKNGVYYIYYFQPNGKRTSKSTGKTRKIEALEFLTDFRKEKHKLESKQILLSEFVKLYLKKSESIHTYTTTKFISSMFREFINLIGDKPLSKVSSSDIQEHLLIKANVSNYTAQKHLAHLRSSFNHAMKLKLIHETPMSGMRNFRIIEKQPNFLTKADFRLLSESIDNEDFRDLVIFAVNTGLRQSEQTNLRWSQFNSSGCSITLDNRSHVTKSKRIRTIPLNKTAEEIILKRNKCSEYIFTYCGEQYPKYFVSKKFKKYIIRAGLNNKIRYHDLRHTFASWLVQADVPIQKISKLLGHADLSTTQIYSHLRTEDLRDSVNRL